MSYFDPFGPRGRGRYYSTPETGVYMPMGPFDYPTMFENDRVAKMHQRDRDIITVTQYATGEAENIKAERGLSGMNKGKGLLIAAAVIAGFLLLKK